MATEDDAKRFKAVLQRYMEAYDKELAKHQLERDALLEKKDEIDNRLHKIEKDAMTEALKVLHQSGQCQEHTSR